MYVYWLEQREQDVPPGNGWLSAEEELRLNALRFAKRRADWRLGRWTAKCALAGTTDAAHASDALNHYHSNTLRKIEICAASSGAPEALIDGQPLGMTISLSHRDGRAVCAVAASQADLGCDLEIIEPRSDAFVADYFTVEEQTLVLRASDADRARLCTLLWSAKESALKALRTGLRSDTRAVMVSAAPAPAGGDDWSPLRIRYSAGNRIFHGWWRQSHNLLRTVVADPAPDPPISLTTHVTKLGGFVNGIRLEAL